MRGSFGLQIISFAKFLMLFELRNKNNFILYVATHKTSIAILSSIAFQIRVCLYLIYN